MPTAPKQSPTKHCEAELKLTAGVVVLIHERKGDLIHERTRENTGDARAPPKRGYWGNFRYKKREFSIQDIIIYHHIS